MVLRILAGILLLLSVLFMPLWVSIILAFGSMVYFKLYAEAPVLFLISDLLYGISQPKYYGMLFVSFLVFWAALVALEAFKKRLKFY